MNRLSAEIGQGSRFQISDDKYFKIDELQLELLTINRGKIPPSSWLHFDEKHRAIIMFPLPGNEGIFKYLLIARHKKSNIEEVEKIEIHVREQTRKYNHEIVFKTNFNLVQFSTDVFARFDFARYLARYCVQKDQSGVWLKSYNKKAKTISVSFNTLEYTPCNLDAINSIKSRMVDSRGRVKSAFQEALSSTFKVTDVSIKLIGPCDPNKESDSGEFDWGIWKHVLPPLLLIVIVGIPVSISCVVRKSRPKRRVAGQSKARHGRWGGTKDELEDFGFHTVHFSNRYSREDENAALPNGSPSHLSPKEVRNCSDKLPNGLGNSVAKSSTNSTDHERIKKEVHVGKSDLNIPCYYNFDPNQPIEPEKSTFESFGEFAGAISSKLKNIKDVAGKSVINVSSLFGQNVEEETSKDVKPNNHETELQDLNNASVEAKTVLSNNRIQTPEGTANATLQTSQYSGEFNKGSKNRPNGSCKEQTPNATGNIVRTEDQMLRDSDRMQHVSERMSAVSGPVQQHSGMQHMSYRNSVTSSPVLQHDGMQHVSQRKSVTSSPVPQHNGMQHVSQRSSATSGPMLQHNGMQHVSQRKSVTSSSVPQYNGMQHVSQRSSATSGPMLQHNGMQHLSQRSSVTSGPVPQHSGMQHVSQRSSATSGPALQHNGMQHVSQRSSVTSGPVPQHSGMQRVSQRSSATSGPALQHNGMQHVSQRSSVTSGPVPQHSGMQHVSQRRSVTSGPVLQHNGMQHVKQRNSVTSGPVPQHSGMQHVSQRSSVTSGPGPQHNGMQHVKQRMSVGSGPTPQHNEMQYESQRMSVGSCPVLHHNRQTPIVSAIGQTFNIPHTFEHVGAQTANAVDQLNGMNAQLHNAMTYSPDTRAQNISVMNWDSRFRSHERELLTNHIPYPNIKQNKSQFDIPSIDHGIVNQAPLHQLQTYHGGFTSMPKRKMSVYEPPDIHSLRPKHSQLTRSRSELSLNYVSNNLEQSRVLSKSDLCLYQSNNEFVSYNNYEDNEIRRKLSLQRINEGGYSIENEVYERRVSSEQNASDYISENVMPEFNTMSITSEYDMSYLSPSESLTSQQTLSVYTMPDHVMSSQVSSGHVMPEHGRFSVNATELPVLTVDDYGLGEPFGRSLHRNQMNQNISKSMLALPVMTRGNGTQYEFGFTPTSSYEDTTSPRGTYHEYTNPFHLSNGLFSQPSASLSDVRGTTYNSGGHQYQQVSTYPDWEEDCDYRNHYQQQRDAYGTFVHSMPNLADNQRGYSANKTGWNNATPRHYPGYHKDEERSLLTKVFGSEKVTKPGVAEDATVVGFLKTKVSSFLG